MNRHVALIRHGDDPPDDRVSTWFMQNGFEIRYYKPFTGDTIGQPQPGLAGTVLYGGKYNVYETDKHPFLLEEYRWIEACLKSKIPMLGICQGAQQIALHLGAFAGPPKIEQHEFGYYRVSPTAEGTDFLPEPHYFCQAHWHTFGIPEGAVCLASSEAFPNQAFRFGDNVYGFQFHAEQTIEGFRRWQQSDWAAWGKPGAQTQQEQDSLMMQHDAAQARWFYQFMEKLFKQNVGQLSQRPTDHHCGRAGYVP